MRNENMGSPAASGCTVSFRGGNLRVIVTGGSGFIGTNLVEHLSARGDEVLNLDIVSPRNQSHASFWRNVDLLDPDKLREEIHKFSPEAILHMGARTDLDGVSLSDYSANTEGLKNIIAAIQGLRSLKRIIFASSRLVCRIGYQPKNDFDYCPSTIYGESKVIGEQVVRDAHNIIPCSWAIVRPTSIWGPWFDIPYKTFFLAIAKGRYFHPGRVGILKSFGFVGNTVYQLHCLLVAAPETITGRIFYLADYPPIDVTEMADKIQERLGVPPVKCIELRWLRIAAKVGDMLKRLGWHDPPLTSFRLDNLLTPMVHDLEPLKLVAGELPYSMEDGIVITTNWLRQRGEVT